MGHARYGGSRIALLEHCPGSAEAAIPYADLPAGPAAERGTRIHEHMERTLRLGLTSALENEESEIGFQAATTVAHIARSHGFEVADLRLEEWLSLEAVHPDAGGTADVWAVKPFGELLVIDLKTGYNMVPAEGNLQLVFYALAAWHSLSELERDFLTAVHLYIVQPAQEAPYTCHIRHWQLTPTELAQYAERVKAIVNRAEAEPANRIAGSHCEDKYCPARATCPAYRAWLDTQSAGLLEAAIADKAIEPPKEPDKLAAVLNAASWVRKWLTACEELAESMLTENPEAVPGWMLTDAFGRRIWLAERTKELERLLRQHEFGLDSFKPRVLAGPAAVERLYKSKGLDPAELADYYIRPRTGKKLVPVKEEKIDW